MQSTELAMYYFKHLEDCKGMEVPPSTKLVYDSSIIDSQPPMALFREPCTVEVVNQDAVEVTLQVLQDDPGHVVVLNLASPTRPGGGVKIGSRAQEEELFRRTAYHHTLLVQFYPMSNDEIVYSPSVPIVRNKDYSWMDEERSAAFIACAGLKWPKVVGGQHFGDETEKECMRRKIRHVYHTAYTEGHTTLVLGALGAGCFRGPPLGIAELFRDEMQPYRFCFKKVIFAILANDIAAPDHGPLGKVFQDVLCSTAAQ